VNVTGRDPQFLADRAGNFRLSSAGTPGSTENSSVLTRARMHLRGGLRMPGGRLTAGWAVALSPTVRALGRHWVFATLMAAGLALRVLVQIAYRPALVYIDSDKYLRHAAGSDPVGYRVMLWPLQRIGGLWLVAGAQHVLGLAMAAALYMLVRRRGAPRWLAAIAAAPVLLDAYQLQAEQTIMPDVMFEALIVAGLVVLLWRNVPAPWQLALGGMLLGAAADVRQVGEILLLPAAAFALAVPAAWRRRLVHGALVGAAFAVPIVAYMTANQLITGNFALTQRGYVLYGRTAFAADCTTLKLPRYERALCPPRPIADRLGIDGIINDPQGPLLTYMPPPGMSAQGAAEDFERTVMRQQPLPVLRSIDRDFVKVFALTRHQSPGDSPINRWQFQTAYPTYPPLITLRYVAGVRPGGGTPAVTKPLATALHAYQLHGGYAPGPLLAAAGLLGLAGALGIAGRDNPASRGGLGPSGSGVSPGGSVSPRTMQTALTRACLLVTLTAGTVLLASDVFEFSWRYQLPALVTLPAAGTLAITAIALRRASILLVPARSAPARDHRAA
jgi:hypothetical protein